MSNLCRSLSHVSSMARSTVASSADNNSARFCSLNIACCCRKLHRICCQTRSLVHSTLLFTVNQVTVDRMNHITHGTQLFLTQWEFRSPLSQFLCFKSCPLHRLSTVFWVNWLCTFLIFNFCLTTSIVNFLSLGWDSSGDSLQMFSVNEFFESVAFADFYLGAGFKLWPRSSLFVCLKRIQI